MTVSPNLAPFLPLVGFCVLLGIAHWVRSYGEWKRRRDRQRQWRHVAELMDDVKVAADRWLESLPKK